MAIQFTPEYLAKADHWCSQLGTKSAEATATAESLKENGKDLLAMIKNKIAIQYDKISDTELERRARASDEWQEFRLGYHQALKDSIIAKQRYTNAERHWDTIRTGISYRKEEIRRISGDTP